MRSVVARTEPQLAPSRVAESTSGAEREPAGRRRGHVWGVGLLAAVAAALYVTIGALAYARYTLGSYDMVIFDQAMRSYAHFGLPVSIVKGVHDGLGQNFSILGDHFSPILALLTPLYWVYGHPVTLLFVEAVLFAAAVPAVWLAARRAVGVVGGYLMAGVFALGWPLIVASARGFHEVAFSVPLMAWALERLLAGRYRQAAALALALLLVKEDMGMLVGVFGLLIALRGGREHRRLGLVVAAAGPIALAFIMFVLIPLGGGSSGYYWLYDQLGTGPIQAFGHVILHPLDTLSIAITPERKWHMLLWLVGPLLLLPLLSPITVLALPLLAERVLSTNGNHWGPNNHYDAFVWPILVMAAIDALARDRPRRFVMAVGGIVSRPWRHRFRSHAASSPPDGQLPGARQSPPVTSAATGDGSRRLIGKSTRERVGVGLAGASLCAMVLALAGWFQPWGLPNGDHGRQDRSGAAAAAVARIPDGATVETDNELGPHLTSRARVLLLDGQPRGAEWVIADTRQWSFPFDSLLAQRFHVALLLAGREYDIVYAHNDYLVLHRRVP
ncbi:MAG TPA: DUF2079 domain-containing protein [Actinomycetes bacterium]